MLMTKWQWTMSFVAMWVGRDGRETSGWCFVCLLFRAVVGQPTQDWLFGEVDTIFEWLQSL